MRVSYLSYIQPDFNSSAIGIRSSTHWTCSVVSIGVATGDAYFGREVIFPGLVISFGIVG